MHGVSNSGFSALEVCVRGDAKMGLCSPTEEEREEADTVSSLAEGRSLVVLAIGSVTEAGAIWGVGEGSSGSMTEGSVRGGLSSSLSTGASG